MRINVKHIITVNKPVWFYAPAFNHISIWEWQEVASQGVEPPIKEYDLDLEEMG